MEKKNYILLKELKVYQLARQLSTKAWLIYSKMNFEDKKHIGDQFIRSIDSVGANIAEGYHRFYYLDKCRFYYNSRASLAEAIEHWLELLLERQKISLDTFNEFIVIHKDLQVRLNNFIRETKNENQNKQGNE
ncbi:MAG: four helix bundle protein [Bacteroidales bacterium]|jgi:four helix bundle protein|nr:four helix bundle protein [Bacteroidales bacterium]